MASRIADLVCLCDHPVGIDQVADALRVVGERVVGVAKDVIERADGLVDVAEQVEWKVVLCAERCVVYGRVERNADDATTCITELLGLITQARALQRSTRGVGFRVPPDEDPVSAFGGEIEDGAIVRGHGERRGGNSGVEHGQLLVFEV